MFTDIEGFGRQLLAAIFLLACMLLSVRIAVGRKNDSAREAFMIGVIALMLGIQYYYLVSVSSFLPASRFYIYNVDVRRVDCEKSSKGGKRALNSYQQYDVNPCFCVSGAGTCVSVTTGLVLSTNSSCPTDGSYKCTSLDGAGDISVYLGYDRNCNGGQGVSCTQDQPCYPCELDAVVAFQSERCRTCSTDFKGDCNFVEGVGPYCYSSPNSRKVVPCKKCCTEPITQIVNGTCY
jgi:hypothetical protein